MTNTRHIQGAIWKKAIAAVVILSAVIFLRSPILWFVGRVQAPLFAFGVWVERTTSIMFGDEQQLGQRVFKLEQERLHLAKEAAEVKQLKTENDQLKALLGFIDRTQTPAVAARIIARTQSPQQTRFLIDRGSSHGIVIGDAVVIDEGVIVGKVIDTTAQTATVGALTDPGQKTAVCVLNQSRTIGLAEGMTGILLRVGLIPYDAVIEVNDLVMTSGLEEGIPSGLLIGIVNSVRADVNNPFQEAVVEPILDLRKYAHVAVLLSNNSGL